MSLKSSVGKIGEFWNEVRKQLIRTFKEIACNFNRSFPIIWQWLHKCWLHLNVGISESNQNRHLEVVAKTFRLQHPSPTSM